MTAFRATLAVASLLTLAASSGAAAQTSLVATMTNGAENPPVTGLLTALGLPRPTSYGFATFTLLEDRSAMLFTATIHNIDLTGTQTEDTNDNLRAAHIHGSSTVTPTMNAGVIWGFFGTPFNDNNPNDIVITPFATGVGGTISGKWDAPEGNNTTLADQVPNILSGRTYINIHTNQFPGGEIRGTLQVVPEPGTVILLGSGLLVLGAIGRRTRRGRATG